MKRNIIGIRPFIQTIDFCGPASLKMIFHYYGVPVSQKEIGRVAGAVQGKGASAEDLKKAAEHFGFDAFWKTDSTIDELRFYIEGGIPVIVDWFWEDDGHYSIVVGLDKNHIYLRDPSFWRIRKKALKKFDDKLWFDYSGNRIESKNMVMRLILVVTPKK